MPSSVCCSNCRTKYTLLNREAGCSNCALSFCKKCLNYRAIIPNLSDKPLTVCYNCYTKLEKSKIKTDAIISSTPLNYTLNPPSSTTKNSSKNWWGDGLPPPSFRAAYSQRNFEKSTESSSSKPFPPENVSNKSSLIDDQTEKLEERRKNLKLNDISINKPLSIEEIENRLANLRECDVEIIRNPKSWFSNHKNIELGNVKTAEELIEIAENRAKLEEADEKNEEKELEELEKRRRELLKNEKDENQKNRESMRSEVSEFSLATQEQLNEINEVLKNAETKVAECRSREKNDEKELQKIMSATRQKSLDAMQWNEQITKEIGGFWTRQNEKNREADEEEKEDDDDEKSLDEETFKKILKEAESCVVDENELDQPNQTKQSTSPKKKGFFDKFFRKDSK